MAKSITKRDLILNTAARTGISPGCARQVVDAFLDRIKDHIIHGRTIELRGFGTFSCKARQARTVRNIRAGYAMQMPKRAVPTLKFCTALRHKVARLLPEVPHGV